jgi:hypothetical protein
MNLDPEFQNTNPPRSFILTKFKLKKLKLILSGKLTGDVDIVHGAEGVDITGISDASLVVKGHCVQNIGARLILDKCYMTFYNSNLLMCVIN